MSAVECNYAQLGMYVHAIAEQAPLHRTAAAHLRAPPSREARFAAMPRATAAWLARGWAALADARRGTARRAPRSWRPAGARGAAGRERAGGALAWGAPGEGGLGPRRATRTCSELWARRTCVVLGVKSAIFVR